MTRKPLILFATALILLSGAACSRIGERASGGDVTVTFRVGERATRATTPGDGNVADGGGISCTLDASDNVIPDLVIFIADEHGNIIKTFPDVGEVVESDYSAGKATVLSVSFNFNDAGEGSYAVYALANTGKADGNMRIDGLSYNASTHEVEPVGEPGHETAWWTAVTSTADLDNLSFAALTATDSPDAGTRMPLSAQGTLTVAKGLYDKYNGLVELDMLRCVAKVQLFFKNLTGEALDIYDCRIAFHDMNPAKGWLFPHDPDFVTLGDTDPADGKDDNYRNFSTPFATPVDLEDICWEDDETTADVDERTLMGTDDPATPGDERTLASPGACLFFPSIAPMQSVPSSGKRYLLDISFRITKSGKTYDASDPTTYELKEFTDLPVHDNKSKDILSLSRNQFLRIETSISKGHNISFNFIVENWTPHHAIVLFH